MRWLVAGAFFVAASGALAGPAAELLGYDPEAPYVSECATQHSTARLVSVVLTRNRPLPERLISYFNLAGLYGAANASCPKDHPPLVFPKSAIGDIKWTAETCAAAAEAVWGPILKARIADAKLKSHPDIAAGFADGVASAIEPVRAACDTHPSFAKLEVSMREFRGDAGVMRRLRNCLLWRKAASKEYDVAKELGETQGRAAGLAHLNGPAMLATAQSKLVCEAQAKASGNVDNSAFQVMLMSLVKTAIESMPEKPAGK